MRAAPVSRAAWATAAATAGQTRSSKAAGRIGRASCRERG